MWKPVFFISKRRVFLNPLKYAHGFLKMSSSTRATHIEGQIKKEDNGKERMMLNYDKKLVLRPTDVISEILHHNDDNGYCGRGLSPIGQPIHETHPHVVTENEITPGITKAEYRKRRKALASLVRRKSSLAVDMRHIVLISASPIKLMANDIPYPFRQETNFFYLTGLLEPDAILMIDVRSNSEDSILFVKPKDPGRELWDGPLSGLTAALSHFGADEAYPLSSFVKILRGKLSKKDPCQIWQDRLPAKSPNAIEKALRSLSSDGTLPNHHSSSLQVEIELLRLIKSRTEINLMIRCGNIISNAFARAMRSTTPGLEESFVHVTIEYECRLQGAQRLSFPPVVAGGTSANTLHYISNSQILRDGDLVLVDAGCEYNGYASDVSRTWPVNGQFTVHQRHLYELVLAVQETCIKAAVVGSTLNQIHQLMLSELGKHLKKSGVLSTNATDSNLEYIASSLCPHHVGHYLGMDTHDTPSVSRQLPLQPGMIITIEPGLYISSDEQRVPEKYRGIGIRIEDNILITTDGPVVLTENCPKTVPEIEETMRIFK